MRAHLLPLILIGSSVAFAGAVIFDAVAYHRQASPSRAWRYTVDIFVLQTTTPQRLESIVQALHGDLGSLTPESALMAGKQHEFQELVPVLVSLPPSSRDEPFEKDYNDTLKAVRQTLSLFPDVRYQLLASPDASSPEVNANYSLYGI